MSEPWDWSEDIVEEEESEFPPSWKPENDGDVLEGIVTDRREGNGKKILEVLVGKDKKWSLWVDGYVLRRAIPPLNVQKGDRLTVTFLGKKELKGGRSLNDFAVSHERGEKPF